MDRVRPSVSARDRGEQGRRPHAGERGEGVPRRRRAGAGRAAQPQARSLRPHRGGPQDDGDGARLRRRVRAEGAPRSVRESGRCHRHPVRRGARVAGRAGARDADAAQGRARGEDEAGRAGHAAAARAGQLGSAAQGRRGGACDRRGRARARRRARAVVGRGQRGAGRNRAGGVLDGRQGDRADRLARSDHRGRRSRRAQAARPQARRSGRHPPRHRRTRRTGKVRFISKTASPATRTYRVDVEIPNSGRLHPGRHHRRGDGAAGADAGGARAALGADLLVERASSACARSTTPTRSRSFP